MKYYNKRLEDQPIIKGSRITCTSLTRIANWKENELRIKHVELKDWSYGDYVLCEVKTPGEVNIELPTGRMAPVMTGDLLIGALGTRHATLEATGSWRSVGEDGQMQVLTGAGLFGKLTSKSMLLPDVIDISYVGHIIADGEIQSMSDFIPDIPIIDYNTPTIIFVGTSMSSGKTTSARIVIRMLKDQGMKVVGGKLTGAGRGRDILTMSDAGADAIYDFVDVGLPSTVVDPNIYEERLPILLSLIQAVNADVAILEVGASPLEPYNGDIAIDSIRKHVKCAVLSASDPYAVLGVMESYGFKPHLVTGPASNTLAGTQLIKKLCKVDALNILDPNNYKVILELILNKLQLNIS